MGSVGRPATSGEAGEVGDCVSSMLEGDCVGTNSGSAGSRPLASQWGGGGGGGGGEKVRLAVGAGVAVGGSRDASLHVIEVHSWRSTCSAALVFSWRAGSSVVAVTVRGVPLVDCA